jgi:thioredoxin 1
VLSPDAFESGLQMSGIQLVDVRTPEEFAGGHLEGAINIDIKSPDFSSRIASELDKDQPVYVYCRSGGRSASAGEYLAAQGYSEIYDLKGGILSWMDSGKKVVK